MHPNPYHIAATHSHSPRPHKDNKLQRSISDTSEIADNAGFESETAMESARNIRRIKVNPVSIFYYCFFLRFRVAEAAVVQVFCVEYIVYRAIER